MVKHKVDEPRLESKRTLASELAKHALIPGYTTLELRRRRLNAFSDREKDYRPDKDKFSIFPMIAALAFDTIKGVNLVYLIKEAANYLSN